MDGLCPEGVEFKLLGSCAAYSDTRVDASDLDEKNFIEKLEARAWLDQ